MSKSKTYRLLWDAQQFDELRRGAPCACFFALESALEAPGQPFELCDEPGHVSYGQLTVDGARVRTCPKCGGDVAAYRSEVLAAHALYREARERYDKLRPMYAGLGQTSVEEVEAMCAEHGALLDDNGDFHRSYLDRAHFLKIVVAYDYDHDGSYSFCHFQPSPGLIEHPFQEDAAQQRRSAGRA